MKRKVGVVYLLVVLCTPLIAVRSSAQGKKDQLKLLETEADTLLNRDDFLGALNLYNKIIAKRKPKSDDDYKILYKRAFAFYGLREFERALTDINQFLLRFKDPQATLLRAHVNQELGKDGDLLADLNTLIAIANDNPDLLRWRTSVLLNLGDYRQAQHDVRALLSYQFDPELQLYLGLTYYYLHDIDSALIEFDRLIESNPSFTKAYEYAGSICLEEEYFDLALQYFNKGLSQESDNTTLLFYKGVALAEKKDLDEGCRLLRKAFDKGMDDAADYLKEYCFGK